MGEANRPVLALDHVRGDCRVERVRRDARPLQERLRGRAQRRGERERLAGGRGKSGDPRAARALRASPEPGAAAAGRCPRRERGPAPARRTGCRPTARGCGAASGARTACPSRSRRNRWSAPTLSGPTGSRRTLSAPSACSSPDDCARSTSRRRAQQQYAARRSLRSANASAYADEASSHWTSSIATRTGSSSASSCEHAANRHPERPRIHRVGRRLLEEERDLERAPPRRRQRRAAPRRERPRTDRPARRERGRARPRPVATRGRGSPRARACSTPASQSVDFPMPASPSSTSAAGSSRTSPMKAWREASSSSLPTISNSALLPPMVWNDSKDSGPVPVVPLGPFSGTALGIRRESSAGRAGLRASPTKIRRMSRSREVGRWPNVRRPCRCDVCDSRLAPGGAACGGSRSRFTTPSSSLSCRRVSKHPRGPATPASDHRSTIRRRPCPKHLHPVRRGRGARPGRARAVKPSGMRPGLTERLARVCAAHPRRVLAAWAGVIVASLVLAGTSLHGLRSDANVTGKPGVGACGGCDRGRISAVGGRAATAVERCRGHHVEQIHRGQPSVPRIRDSGRRRPPRDRKGVEHRGASRSSRRTGALYCCQSSSPPTRRSSRSSRSRRARAGPPASRSRSRARTPSETTSTSSRRAI